MLKYFKDHPASVNETYLEHMGSAASFAVPMMVAGFACLLHGFLPFVFQSTGRDTVSKLHRKMVTHRVKMPDGTHAPLEPAE